VSVRILLGTAHRIFPKFGMKLGYVRENNNTAGFLKTKILFSGHDKF
jgi:hypothetical protein